MKPLGRALLWLLVLVVLLRGLSSLLEPRDAAPVAQQPRSVPAAWPDDDARAFAARFAQKYLSYEPKRPGEFVQSLRAFAAPELAESIAPSYDEEHAPAQRVASVTVARTLTLDPRHVLVTVAAIVEGGATRYLTVPVARDDAGGLVVSDLPSFAAAPTRASLKEAAVESLSAAERASIEPVVARFLRAYLAGDASGLEYLVPAGLRIAVPQVRQQLVDVAELSLAAPASGRERLVLAAVHARDSATGGVFFLRYRLRLVRQERWYVAAVNQATGKGA